MQDVDVGGMRVAWAPRACRGVGSAHNVVHEASGLNADARGIAGRLHGEGCAVAAPDRYSTGTRPVCVARCRYEVVIYPGVGHGFMNHSLRLHPDGDSPAGGALDGATSSTGTGTATGAGTGGPTTLPPNHR